MFRPAQQNLCVVCLVFDCPMTRAHLLLLPLTTISPSIHPSISSQSIPPSIPLPIPLPSPSSSRRLSSPPTLSLFRRRYNAKRRNWRRTKMGL